VPSRSSDIRALVPATALAVIGSLFGMSAGSAASLAPAEPPDCSDDVDNDGDGYTDYDGGPPEGTPDPGCEDLNDDELPFNTGAPSAHDRTVTFVRSEHEARKDRTVLIVRGHLVTDDGTDGCSSDVPVKIERLVGGTWTKINRGRTHERDADEDGDYRFRLTVGDLEGRYRLVAPRTVLDSSGVRNVCLHAQQTIRHRHGS
jgi:hypothetical protein